MPDELDHEVIDSPQALFRHLYEAHGLVEALDLDPETAPLQFWLRRHAELERAATASPSSAGSGGAATSRNAASSGGTAGQGPGRSGQSRGRSGQGPGTAGQGPGRSGQGPGPRFRPFADPLVEALATALVGLGLDERHVRRGLSTFTGTDGRHGEEAVRASFLEPILDALTARLTGAPSPARGPQPPPETLPWPPTGQAPASVSPTGGTRPAAGGPPTGQAPGRASPSGRTRPAAPAAPAAGVAASARTEPPAAEHETWVAQPLAARGPGPEPEPDYMAIADVLQERRRSRRGGRREAPKPSRTAASEAPPPSAARPPPQADPNDDFMALADAIQARRANRPH